MKARELSLRTVSVCGQWAFTLLLIYAVWRWLLDPHLSPVLFASPAKVFSQLGTYASNGDLWAMVGTTLSEALAGFAIGALTGIIAALAIGSMRPRYGKVFEPIIGGFYAMPKFVLAPLLFLWLGTGFAPRTVLVTVSVFPLVAIYSLTGIRTVDADTVRMMQLAGASKLQIARKLMLPHTGGYLVISLVLAGPHALTVAIASEILFGASNGIGGFLYTSSEAFSASGVLATLIIGTAVALLLFGITRALEHRLLSARGLGRLARGNTAL
ncbi:MAG TPA: ABC transporter permease subunit [Streptosporangiaceae bacterium]|jgi:NitT/TauT family transport system permease protein|nr:ABC transporter permease subunit [Streptosporangiaceae bacterium]